MPWQYRILAKTILFCLQFKIYRQKFGDAGFWLVTNKPMPQVVHDEDIVVVNKNAQTGQVRSAKLVCDGEVGKIKCRWVLDVKKDL